MKSWHLAVWKRIFRWRSILAPELPPPSLPPGSYSLLSHKSMNQTHPHTPTSPQDVSSNILRARRTRKRKPENFGSQSESTIEKKSRQAPNTCQRQIGPYYSAATLSVIDSFIRTFNPVISALDFDGAELWIEPTRNAGFLKHGGRILSTARLDVDLENDSFSLSQYRNIVSGVFKNCCKLSRFRKLADSKGCINWSEQKEVTFGKVLTDQVKSLVLVSLNTPEGFLYPSRSDFAACDFSSPFRNSVHSYIISQLSRLQH